jgi:hypothetical protein
VGILVADGTGALGSVVAMPVSADSAVTSGAAVPVYGRA